MITARRMRKEKVMSGIKKDKGKLLATGYLVLICLLMNPYAIQFILYLFKRSEFVMEWNIIRAYKTLLQQQPRLVLLLILLEIVLVWQMTHDKKTYKSNLYKVTPDIQIPVPAGENQCGSAWWLKQSDYKRVFGTAKYQNEILQGNNHKAGLVLGKKDVSDGEIIYYVKIGGHVLSIGTTRSGKTRCMVLPTIAYIGLAGDSMLNIDMKGELYDYTSPFLQEQDYETIALDFANPKRSRHWNFLQPVIDAIDQDDIPGAIDATWDIVSQLVGKAKSEPPIWRNGECATIAGSILSVVYDNRHPRNRKYQNMTNVYFFIAEMNIKSSDDKALTPLQMYKKSLPDSHPAKGLFAIAEVAPRETGGSFFTSALTTLRLFTNPNIAAMTGDSDFRPEDMGNKKMAVYIILPDDRDTYHPIAALAIAQFYQMLSKEAERHGGVLPHRVHHVADEFGNFPAIPSIRQMLSVGAGKGLYYYLFLQNLSQLTDVYDKETADIISSQCETWVYLRSDDNNTLKTISERLGKYTVSSYSTGASAGTSSGSGSTNYSVQLIGRELLFPDEVGRIKRPYSLVLSRSDPAILYAPDLSEWKFNEALGMGDPEHNIRLRMEAKKLRPEQEPEELQLWNIWKKYQESIVRAEKAKRIKEAERKKEQSQKGRNEK